MKAPLLVARRLGRAYLDPYTGKAVAVVDDIDLEVPAAGTLGILGASGAGKSTLTRLILGLEKPDHGTVLFDDVDLQKASARQKRSVRRRMQAVFQDPRSSLNPHLRVGTIIAEPLLAQGGYGKDRRRRRVIEALDMVGLGRPFADRRPERLSGGERQRVAIARAIAPEPDLVVLDEPVSSLDGPVRGQILHLLAELTARLELAIVMVSHDVRSIVTLTGAVMVMYAGRCVEKGPATEVLENPLHPYTQALLAAAPRRGNDLTLTLDPATPAETGCACREWCPLADQRCKDQPELKERESNHRVACWVE